MYLTPDLVAQYREIVENPVEKGFGYCRPMKEWFVASDSVRSLSDLFMDIFKETATHLPKIIFYILLQEMYGNPTGKDERGDLGYHLQYDPPKIKK